MMVQQKLNYIAGAGTKISRMGVAGVVSADIYMQSWKYYSEK